MPSRRQGTGLARPRSATRRCAGCARVQLVSIHAGRCERAARPKSLRPAPAAKPSEGASDSGEQPQRQPDTGGQPQRPSEAKAYPTAASSRSGRAKRRRIRRRRATAAAERSEGVSDGGGQPRPPSEAKAYPTAAGNHGRRAKRRRIQRRRATTAAERSEGAGVRVAEPPLAASEATPHKRRRRPGPRSPRTRVAYRLRGRYWVRTSDLFGVNEARYHCANRPYWWCCYCFVLPCG